MKYPRVGDYLVGDGWKDKIIKAEQESPGYFKVAMEHSEHGGRWVHVLNLETEKKMLVQCKKNVLIDFYEKINS